MEFKRLLSVSFKHALKRRTKRITKLETTLNIHLHHEFRRLSPTVRWQSVFFQCQLWQRTIGLFWLSRTQFLFHNKCRRNAWHINKVKNKTRSERVLFWWIAVTLPFFLVCAVQFLRGCARSLPMFLRLLCASARARYARAAQRPEIIASGE